MAFQEKFFVQTFEMSAKNKLLPGQSYPVATEDQARARAEALSNRVIGVVAFSQMVDETAGDAEEPVLLAYYGSVPPEARAAA